MFRRQTWELLAVLVVLLSALLARDASAQNPKNGELLICANAGGLGTGGIDRPGSGRSAWTRRQADIPLSSARLAHQER